MGHNNEHSKQYFCQINMILLYIIEGIAIVMLVILASELSENVLSVPLVVVFGIIVFLGALTISASIFDHYKLSDKYEALGLPSGSVRALIALTLILIFAIMVISMSSNLAVVEEYQYVGNSTTGNFTVVYGGKEYTAINGTLTLLVGPSEAAINFSNQVLTTVSTLVVALAGFYFGTRSVAQAQKSTEPPEANLSTDPKSPATLDLGKSQELAIKVTTTPENELIGCRVEKQDDGTIISEKPNEFKYIPSDKVKKSTEASQVTLLFWMVKYPGDLKELKVNIIPKK